MNDDILVVDRRTETIPRPDGSVMTVTTGIKVKVDDSEHWLNILNDDDWKKFEEFYNSRIKDVKSYKEIEI